MERPAFSGSDLALSIVAFRIGAVLLTCLAILSIDRPSPARVACPSPTKSAGTEAPPGDPADSIVRDMLFHD